MQDPTKNAIFVCTCLTCLTLAYAREQFASHPIDNTSPDAHYSGGTVSTLSTQHIYVPAPPAAPVDGRRVLRELRWDDT